MRILLTGFEPFAGATVNPSEQAARCLDRQTIAGAEIRAALLPVDAEKGPQALMDALHSTRPDAVICLGEATGRAAISVERIAVNLLDFRIADNRGSIIVDQPVISGGPAAYFVTLPARALVDAILEAGVPAELSMTAGTFLCNQVLYHLLHHLDLAGWRIPAGFLHLPCLPEQAAKTNPRQSSMGLEVILTGLRAAITCLVPSEPAQA